MTVNQELVQVKHSMIYGQYGGQLIFPSDWVRKELAETMLAIPSEAGLVTPDAYQRYPVSTQLRNGLGLFRYSKAGATLANIEGFMYFAKSCPGLGGNGGLYGFEGGAYANIAAGDTSFKVADTGAVKNIYEGALFVTYDTTNSCYSHHIILGNDVSTGVYTVLYIAPPGFKNAITATSGPGIDCYLSPYSYIDDEPQTYKSAVGVAHMAVPSGYYFWLQTAGLISGMNVVTNAPGETALNRDVFLDANGFPRTADGTLAYVCYQRVGYIFPGTSGSYAESSMMLQLDQ